MHNKYNKEYIGLKSERDDYMKTLKLQNQVKIRNIRETYASKIKADHQQKIARNLAEYTDP